MCTTLYCDDPLADITSVSDLLTFIPEDELVLHDHVLRPGQSKAAFLAEEGNTCLCSVNIQASFIGNKRWTVVPDDHGFPGDWLIVPRDDGGHA